MALCIGMHRYTQACDRCFISTFDMCTDGADTPARTYILVHFPARQFLANLVAVMAVVRVYSWLRISIIKDILFIWGATFVLIGIGLLMRVTIMRISEAFVKSCRPRQP
jgi:hypothetical protein